MIYLRNKSWKPECVLKFNMGWQILVFLSLILASMIYFLNKKKCEGPPMRFLMTMVLSFNTIFPFPKPTTIFLCRGK
jgi:hypothetical protein